MGIFADKANGLWTVYKAQLKFRSQIRGGTPKDPKVIEGWLRAKAGITDEWEIREATMRTMREMGVEVPDDATMEDMEKISEQLALQRQCVGFKQDERGLYIEGRIVKAMLKEATNIVITNKMGKTAKKNGDMTEGKKAKSFLAERVFVDPDRIYLGVDKPTGVDLFIGHLMTRQGPQSSLTYYEYVDSPTVEFTVKVLRNEIPWDYWAQIWEFAQDNGLGSQRSQGFGRFDILQFELIGQVKGADRSAPAEALA